ncbi:MAG: hypothetical protein AB1646_14150 [Thermodesulfobacteriota bacterium]
MPRTRKKRLGKLAPRYSFMLNPYVDIKLSVCPACRRSTHKRKFALFIYVEGGGLVAQGLTCRYCTPCELIMVSQQELEEELALTFDERKPEVIGNPYVVVGTIDMKVWKASLGGNRIPAADALAHAADFKRVYGLDPGGWRPAK